MNRRCSNSPYSNRLIARSASVAFGSDGLAFVVHVPGREMLERRERGPVLGPDPVAYHARHVAAERQRQFLHVGHHLGVRAFQARVLVPGFLQLDDGQRQSVDIEHDVEPALVITIDDHDLVGGQEVVRVRVAVVDQADRRVVLRAMLVRVARRCGCRRSGTGGPGDSPPGRHGISETRRPVPLLELLTPAAPG